MTRFPRRAFMIFAAARRVANAVDNRRAPLSKDLAELGIDAGAFARASR